MPCVSINIYKYIYAHDVYILNNLYDVVLHYIILLFTYIYIISKYIELYNTLFMLRIFHSSLHQAAAIDKTTTNNDSRGSSMQQCPLWSTGAAQWTVDFKASTVGFANLRGRSWNLGVRLDVTMSIVKKHLHTYCILIILYTYIGTIGIVTKNSQPWRWTIAKDTSWLVGFPSWWNSDSIIPSKPWVWAIISNTNQIVVVI